MAEEQTGTQVEHRHPFVRVMRMRMTCESWMGVEPTTNAMAERLVSLHQPKRFISGHGRVVQSSRVWSACLALSAGDEQPRQGQNPPVPQHQRSLPPLLLIMYWHGISEATTHSSAASSTAGTSQATHPAISLTLPLTELS